MVKRMKGRRRIGRKRRVGVSGLSQGWEAVGMKRGAGRSRRKGGEGKSGAGVVWIGVV